MIREISESGIPIIQVYGLTVKHDGPFWINEADYDPALHRHADESAQAKPATTEDSEPEPVKTAATKRRR